MSPIRFATEGARRGLMAFAGFLVLAIVVVGSVTAKMYASHDPSMQIPLAIMGVMVFLFAVTLSYHLRTERAKRRYEEVLEREFPQTEEKLIIEEKRFRGAMLKIVRKKRAAEKDKATLLKKVSKASFLTDEQADQCEAKVDAFNESIATGTADLAERYRLGKGVHFRLPRNESDFATMRPITID